MSTLTIEGAGTTEVEPGTKLVLAIVDAGVDILHRCGGNAKCTTCRVQVLEGNAGPIGVEEQERLAREASFGPDIRLSCQVRVENDLSIRVISRSGESGMTPGPRPLD